jgi:hypothetical protein
VTSKSRYAPNRNAVDSQNGKADTNLAPREVRRLAAVLRRTAKHRRSLWGSNTRCGRDLLIFVVVVWF